MPSHFSVNRRQAGEILRHSRGAVADVWTDLRSFEFKWIVPYETVFSAAVARNPTTWVMLVFGFAPLLGFHVAGSTFQQLAWLLTYFALAWAAYFHIVVAKRSCSLPIGFAVALFTIVVGCQMDIWLKQVPPMSWLYTIGARRDGIESVLASIAGVGVNEEMWKAVPVLVLAFWLSRVTRPLDGLFYGALSGLGFAVREGLQFTGRAADAGDLLHSVLIRTTSMPFLHATWSAIGGYFIGLAVVSRDRKSALCILGITTAAALHGWYDFAAQHVMAVGIAALSYILLVSYVERSQDMVERLRRSERVAGPVGEEPVAERSGH